MKLRKNKLFLRNFFAFIWYTEYSRSSKVLLLPTDDQGGNMKKKDIEFRYYEMPVNSYVLAKLGSGWEQEYGIADAAGLLHFHNYLEIGYCYHGHGILTITDKDYRYSGDMFSIIPANIPHTTHSDPGNICKWEFLFVDIDAFLKNEMADTVLSVSRALHMINSGGRLLKTGEHERLGSLIRMIIEECRSDLPNSRECIKGYLRALVIEMLRLNEEGEVKTGSLWLNRYIEKTINFIEAHYMEGINVADIARACGLSESHFRRVFEESTGMRPIDFLNMVRVNKACELMIKKDMSMENVGKAVGFQTASGFNRNFKRLTGFSPLQWKNKGLRQGVSLKNYKVSTLKGWEA